MKAWPHGADRGEVPARSPLRDRGLPRRPPLGHGGGGWGAFLVGALGPHLSGLLAPFPIITSVLAVFTHAHGGVNQVVLLLRNFLLGFYGFAAFCFSLAISLPDLSTAAAFTTATAAALIVQGVSLALRSRLVRTPTEALDAPG